MTRREMIESLAQAGEIIPSVHTITHDTWCIEVKDRSQLLFTLTGSSGMTREADDLWSYLDDMIAEMHHNKMEEVGYA